MYVCVISRTPPLITPHTNTTALAGVDEMSWDDMSKNHKAWPSVAEVRDYRKQVQPDRQMLHYLAVCVWLGRSCFVGVLRRT